MAYYNEWIINVVSSGDVVCTTFYFSTGVSNSNQRQNIMKERMCSTQEYANHSCTAMCVSGFVSNAVLGMNIHFESLSNQA